MPFNRYGPRRPLGIANDDDVTNNDWSSGPSRYGRNEANDADDNSDSNDDYDDDDDDNDDDDDESPPSPPRPPPIQHGRGGRWPVTNEFCHGSPWQARQDNFANLYKSDDANRSQRTVFHVQHKPAQAQARHGAHNHNGYDSDDADDRRRQFSPMRQVGCGFHNRNIGYESDDAEYPQERSFREQQALAQARQGYGAANFGNQNNRPGGFVNLANGNQAGRRNFIRAVNSDHSDDDSGDVNRIAQVRRNPFSAGGSGDTTLGAGNKAGRDNKIYITNNHIIINDIRDLNLGQPDDTDRNDRNRRGNNQNWPGARRRF